MRSLAVDVDVEMMEGAERDALDASTARVRHHVLGVIAVGQDAQRLCETSSQCANVKDKILGDVVKTAGQA